MIFRYFVCLLCYEQFEELYLSLQQIQFSANRMPTRLFLMDCLLFWNKNIHCQNYKQNIQNIQNNKKHIFTIIFPHLFILQFIRYYNILQNALNADIMLNNNKQTSSFGSLIFFIIKFRVLSMVYSLSCQLKSFINQNKLLIMLLQLQKQKRTHSGSRSKSKKYKGNEYSVDLRGKVPTQPTQSHKIKTENSSSLNKSKPSRKNSTKQQKKHTKSNNKEPKDPTSHSVSADRRHSFIKINRTQANFDQDDLQTAVDQLLLGIRRIPQPPCMNARLLGQYFSDLQRFYSKLDKPFQRLCTQMHFFYLNPMQKFLDLVAPMQEAIRRKDQIAKEIDKQIVQNEELFSKLEPIDIEIFKLKQKIEQNRVLIQKKRSQKQQSHSRQKQQLRETPIQTHVAPQVKIEGIGKGFKLDLQNVHKSGHLGYHQQFYSKIEQFSQSWRDQALRQKRF